MIAMRGFVMRMPAPRMRERATSSADSGAEPTAANGWFDWVAEIIGGMGCFLFQDGVRTRGEVWSTHCNYSKRCPEPTQAGKRVTGPWLWGCGGSAAVLAIAA